MAMTDDRAISTVLDVTLALVLISASVLMLFVFLGNEDTQSDPVQADRTAETLAGTTTTLDYSLEAVLEDDDHNESIFEDVDEDSHYLDRSARGPLTGLLADAAVVNADFWGNEWSQIGVDFEQAVDGATLGSITGLDHSVRIDAVWIPYEGSGIVGEASAGRAVPPDADTNSVTFVAPSGVEEVSKDIEDRFGSGELDEEDLDEVGKVIAEAILEHLLPPEAMQRDLESSSANRDLAMYRYNRMSLVMETIHDDDWDESRLYEDDHRYPFQPDVELDRNEANALWLNQYVVEQTLGVSIADDLRGEFDSPTVEELTDAVSTAEAQVTVRTWDTHE